MGVGLLGSNGTGCSVGSICSTAVDTRGDKPNFRGDRGEVTGDTTGDIIGDDKLLGEPAIALGGEFTGDTDSIA